MEQNDSLYERARQILQGEPEMGKQRLADRLGVRTPTSRRLLHRFRGETQGHSNDPAYQKVRKLKDANPDWGAGRIADQLGITVDHAMMHLARWLGAQSYQASGSPPSPSALPAEPTAPADGAELQISGNDESQAMSYRGSRIKTIEDLLAFSKTDTKIWEVEKHVINKWEVGAKDPLSGGILTEPLYQLKLWLRRKVAEQKLRAVMDGLLEQFRKAAPIRPALPRRPGAKGLLEISIMDHHLGKYCASAETRGMAYDCEISERLFITALEDLLHKSANLPVEKILMVCGNDYLNTADGHGTQRNTIQDEDRRYHETFLRGRQLLVRAIDRLREVAPVEVVMVTGNHEGQRLYYLGSALESWYRNTRDIVVDNRPAQRKYFLYHRNLIGFTHGDNEKHFDLPLLLATENPDGWAASRHREFHLGHFHSRKLKMFVPSFDRTGVLVRILPSLCPPDAWHAAMGYRSRLSAEALYFDPEEGCVANFIHSPN